MRKGGKERRKGGRGEGRKGRRKEGRIDKMTAAEEEELYVQYYFSHGVLMKLYIS